VQKAGFLLGKNLCMARGAFQKSAASPEQLLQKLLHRGLLVTNSTQALSYLRFVGGYRLKGYWFHAADPVTKNFQTGFSFDHIVQRCEFDRELRAATITAIDRLEVAIRTAMANYLSMAHGPHWFLETRIFKPTHRWGMGRFVKKIEDEVARAKGKQFVEHYFEHYDEPYLPPSWVISECVTFGLWSNTFAILRDPSDRRAIAKKFGVDQPEVFKSWIHTLTVVRNIAAHHGQLLRVKLGVSPMNYKAKHIQFSQQKSFFAAATVIQYLLNQTALTHSWKSDLQNIFNKHDLVPISDLGFLPNWQKAVGW
jgi:abortive infection bacteriophage resistance protein